MGRKKIIGTDELISWVDKFRIEHPDDKIRIPDLGNYIRRSRPGVSDVLIRRDANVRQYIEDLNAESLPETLQTVSNFKTIDIESFLEKNCSRTMLAEALRARDQYYSRIAASAATIFDRYERQKAELRSLQSEYDNVKNAYDDLKQKKKLEMEKRACETIKSLRNVIETYINPEIANEILRKEGLLQFPGNRVKKDAVENIMVNTKTIIGKEVEETYEKLMKGFD